jgi:hypothetical protein
MRDEGLNVALCYTAKQLQKGGNINHCLFVLDDPDELQKISTWVHIVDRQSQH